MDGLKFFIVHSQKILRIAKWQLVISIENVIVVSMWTATPFSVLSRRVSYKRAHDVSTLVLWPSNTNNYMCLFMKWQCRQDSKCTLHYLY